MGYTTDEKEAAVLRIIQGKPGFQRSSLATRRVDSTYEEVSELVKTAFFFEPDTVYYLIYLSSNYYTRKVGATLDLLESMLDAIDDLLVRNRPVENVGDIAVARRALQDMESALARNGVVSSMAYSRYRSAMARSKAVMGKTVKLSRVPRGSATSVTDVVRPRDEAKSVVASSLGTLRTLHAEILESVDLLLAAESAYNSTGMATAVAKKQVQRASSDLTALSNTLNGLTPKQRITEARSSLLRLLANSSTVKALSEVAAPGSAKLYADPASPQYRISAYGEGTAPAVTGSESAPWRIEDGSADVLKVDVGGTVVTTDLLPGAGYNIGIQPAEVTGSKHENFRIGEDRAIPYPMKTKAIATGGTYAVSGKTLYMIVDGVRYEVSFGSNRTAAQLASDIGGSALNAVVSIGVVINQGGYDWVQLTYDVGSPPDLYRNRFMMVSSGRDNASDLGPWKVVEAGVGDHTLDLSMGWDDNTELWVQPNDDSTHTIVHLTPGSYPTYERTAAQVKSDIDSYGGTKFEARVDAGRIVVASERLGNGSVIAIKSAGLSSGRGTPSYNGMVELGFAHDMDSREGDIPIQVVLGVLNRNPSFNAVAVAGAQRDVKLNALSATVTGSNTIEIDLLEETVDPSTDWELSDIKAFIHSGDNAGQYGVTATDWSAPTLELTLDRNLRDQTATNRHLVTVFAEHLVITSKSAATSAYVQVDGTVGNSAHTALGLSTTKVIGTVESVLVEYNDPVTGWKPVDVSRLKIRVGDKLVDALGVDAATISSVSQASSGILGVEPVASDLSLAAGFSVVSAASLLHDAFEENLQNWLDGLAPYDDESLKRIDTILGPILILEEPSRSQVDSAYNVVEAYRDKISSLNDILRGFSIVKIASVDTALRGMLQHGHDRARELLLQCRFEEYLEVTARTASYSRALMDAASSVSIEDINEPTTTRNEDESEFDRFRVGWVEDEDPALSLENEEEIPDTPLENYWPDDQLW